MRKLSSILFISCLFILTNCKQQHAVTQSTDGLKIEENAILSAANSYLEQAPITITAFQAERSAGGLHDYYSEGAYWWPNPEDPNGPYIRRDGIRNPNNFKEHKNALRELAEAVKTLTAAFLLTQDEKYARHAIRFMTTWFADPATRMNPSLLYGQAIKGISSGRGIGIIDTLPLIDVALSIEILRKKGILTGTEREPIVAWFNDFGDWLTTHPYGDDERDNNNNHSTWWGAQVAAFARVAERDDLLKISQDQYREQLDIQMAADGSLPDELVRTKPFHYMNYTLRAWGTFALLASTEKVDLWEYKSKNGQLQKAFDFALPFLIAPKKWPYLSELEPEIQPHRNDFLVFAYWGLQDAKYLQLWEQLPEEGDANAANLILWENILNNE
jgi:hypothetical protein